MNNLMMLQQRYNSALIFEINIVSDVIISIVTNFNDKYTYFFHL